MRLIQFQSASGIDEALRAGSVPDTAFLAGGTSLVDLMKLEVLHPARVVDVGRLALTRIDSEGGGLRIGALATNTDVAQNGEVKKKLPALSEALLSGASPQLRNAATVGGNLLQRTRCAYYRDLATACNKRNPGAGCDALQGWTRMHGVRGAAGERDIPFAELHLFPGEHPEREFALAPGELIISVFVPATPQAARSRYLKVRDRASYAFALASCAAALHVEGGRIRAAGLALGGVGTKPWRVPEAEAALVGQAPSAEAFGRAAEIALRGARMRPDNAFKVELARRTAVRALRRAAEAT